MPDKWRRATLVLLAAGAAEAAAGLVHGVRYLGLILGGATLAVALITLRNRKGRFDGGTWLMALLGSSLAFRALVYDVPALARALVGLGGVLYLCALVLGYAAWRAEVQAMLGPSAGAER